MLKTVFSRSFFAAAIGVSALSAAAAQETIKIGAVYPMTGPIADDGASISKGSRLALKQFNDAGGLKGQKIELAIEDGACIPAQSVLAAEKLVSADRVKALLGAFCSSSTGAVMNVAQKYKVPFVAGISTAPDLTERGNRYLFRIPATSAMLSNSFAEVIMQRAGGKRIAFLVVNDDWGRSIAATYAKALQKYGAEVVGTQIFNASDTDLFPYITNVKGARPDAVILAANTANAVSLTEQVKQMGLNVPLIGEGSFTAKTYYDLVGTKGDGIYGLVGFMLAFDNPINKSFIEAYRKEHGEVPNQYSAAGYNEMLVILGAMKSAGTADPEAVRDAIEKGTTEGIAGPVKFTPKGQGYGFSVFLTQNEKAAPKLVSSVEIAKPE